MSRQTGPKHRMCRIVGRPLCGSDHCPALKRPYPPGQHGAQRKSRKKSEYAVHLLEKQKLRFMYGVQERQFRRYHALALRDCDITGRALLRLLETRLDNIVYRLGYAKSIHAARQLVTHGHVTVNQKRVDIPSCAVRAGDVIGLSNRALQFSKITDSLSEARPIPPYLSYDETTGTGTLSRNPDRDEIPVEIDETLIVEYYAHS